MKNPNFAIALILFLFLPILGWGSDIQELQTEITRLTQDKGPLHRELALLHFKLANEFKKANNLEGAEEHFMASNITLPDEDFNDFTKLTGADPDYLEKLYSSMGRTWSPYRYLQLLTTTTEKYLGRNHPRTMAYAGSLLINGKDDSDIEDLLKRRISSKEKALRAGYLDDVDELVTLYERQKRVADVEALLVRTIDFHEKNGTLDFLQRGSHFEKLLSLYITQKRFAEAESYCKRILDAMEKQYGPNDLSILIPLDLLIKTQNSQGRSSEIQPLLERAIAITEKHPGTSNWALANRLTGLANIYEKQGHIAEAKALSDRATGINQDPWGNMNMFTADSLDKNALVARAAGNMMAAAELYERASAIKEMLFGRYNPSVIYAKADLAQVYGQQGRYAESEQLLKQVIAAIDKSAGSNNSDFAEVLGILGSIYYFQGRYDDADLSMSRAYQILAANHIEDESCVTLLGNMGELYRKQGRYSEAEPLLLRALSLSEKVYGPVKPIRPILENLARVYIAQGRLNDAEPLITRILRYGAVSFDTEDRRLANSVITLGELYQARGNSKEAEQYFQRAVKLLESGGAEHRGLVVALAKLVTLYQAEERYAEALPLSRRSFQTLRNRALELGTDSTSALSERLTKKISLQTHIGLLARLEASHSLPHSEVVSEAYEAAQLTQNSRTGDAVARMSARFSSGSDPLAQKVRDRQDVVNRIQESEDKRDKAILNDTQLNSALTQRLTDELAILREKLTRFNHQLDKEYPQYVELTRFQLFSIVDTQRLLKPDEVLLAYVLGEKESYLFVVRSSRAELIKLDIGRKAIESSVQLIRQRLSQDVDGISKLRPFDAAEAFSLYQKVFAPAEQYITGAKHIMLVLDGALESIPFATLVSEMPNEKIKTPEDHRKLAWLAKRYAFTTLPSVSSLRALRTFSKRSLGDQPFIGFGDPALEGRQGEERGRKNVMMASLFNNRGIVADVGAIRQLDPLPDTAVELKTIAKALKANESAIFMQSKATETNVKRVDLTKARVLAFSTHGAMAGELKGYAEPGLILTPPKDGTELDDGYLSASEIAQLKLNADWVLLSACNTAAADGKPGAEGLSGLAKAFFYAGARSLLVSHWPVDSDATRQLVTNLFSNYTSKPGSGKAEALNQAALGLMNDPKNPHFAHPYFWAPFVVAGEGGGSAPP